MAGVSQSRYTFPMAQIHRLVGMGGNKLVPQLAGHPVDGAEAGYGEEFDKLRSETVALAAYRSGNP